jgi:flagellar protein FliO/FliZ
MRQLITALGASLLWASVLVAADSPANRDGPFNLSTESAPQSKEWPWSNSPAEASPRSGVMESSPATPAASESKVQQASLAGRLEQAAEFAPEPPRSPRSDVLPTAFERDAALPAATRSEKPNASDAASSRARTAIKPSSPPRPDRNAPAPPIPPAAAQSAPVAAPSIPQAVSAPPISLASHNDKNPGKTSPLAAMISVGGSLALVLGLFLVIAWAMRKTAPRGSLLLPREVFEVLGRAPLGARQQVQLLRCGNKLLLVSIMPGGTETLTEVTDPLEVDRIAGICQQANPKSATMAFRQVFQQLAPKTGGPSAFDSSEPSGPRQKRYRWEKNHA